VSVGHRRVRSRVLVGLAVVAVLAFTLFPIYMMLTMAVDERANSASRSLLPTKFTLDHFSFVLDEGGFSSYLLNSAIVAGGTIVASGMLALLAAVAVSRFKFRFRTSVLVMVLVIQMVPLEALVIPMFIQARDLRLLNSLLGLVVVYVAFSLPISIWMLRGFVAAVPKEIEEAAYVDGASWRRMFWSILFPLVAPGLVAVSVFSFIMAWNEFIFALTFNTDVNPKRYTAAVGLRRFFGQYANEWGPIMAGSTLITLPVMIFFVIVQRRLSTGLVAGSVKG
jgi:N,N'-diacetylchitobiose transport system permease protein